jgi:hypothetical protein
VNGKQHVFSSGFVGLFERLTLFGSPLSSKKSAVSKASRMGSAEEARRDARPLADDAGRPGAILPPAFDLA